MRIAMIATGGTIGSKVKQDGWISPDTEAPYEVLRLFQMKYPALAEKVEINSRMPYQILSENLEAEYLVKLLDEVGACIEAAEYGGIIVCHGTDTLQYTAAMLEYIYGNQPVPILLVSSNYPLEDARANGLDNFRYAVQRILDGYCGVGVVYRNADGNTYIHRGDRLMEHAVFEDDLHSVYEKYVGRYDRDGVWIAGALAYMTDLKAKDNLQIQTNHAYDYHILKKESGILWLHNAPGIVYPAPEQVQGIRAILIQSYHAGTMRVDSAFRNFVWAMAEKDIPVYLLGIEQMQDGYETKQAYRDCGVKIPEGIAPIAAYCKLWLQLSQDLSDMPIEQIQNREIRGIR